MQDCVGLTIFHFLQQATRFQCGLRNVSLGHVPHESFAQTFNQSLEVLNQGKSVELRLTRQAGHFAGWGLEVEASLRM